ncbi:MAG: hypothetical protein J2P37_31165, partial [Ktedonobacteraceae bacterium]|nr:hypothetical protein [Ktedonobacteraceae bacterium]
MMEPTTKRVARIQRLPLPLYVLLTLVLLAGGGGLTFIHPRAAHADTTWSATLGANPVWNGLQCSGGDGGADAVVTLGDVSAWQTIPANNQVDYIYCKVTDTSFPFPHAVTVTVNYWDGPSNGSYVLQYDSTGGAYSPAEAVSMTGTSLWMTHTFTLYDASFAGEENNGADFRIATENNAPVGVAVSQITVALSNVPAPPAIQQAQSGNVFLPGQTPTFNFTTTTGSVNYQVYNADNNLVASGAAPATSGKGSITVKGLPYGNYTLVAASDNNGTLSPPVMNAFGVMPAAISPNRASPFGAVIHIDQGQDPQFQGLLSNVGLANLRGLGPLPTWS